MRLDVTSTTPIWTTEHTAEAERLARRHATRFPWYGRLLAERSGLLPIIEEKLLSAYYYTADLTHLADASAYHTSGTSTGRRKRILYSPSDDEAYLRQRRTLFTAFAGPVRPGEVAVADLGTGHAAASARHIFAAMGFEARDIDFTAAVGEHVEKLNAWQPDVLFTMPMILDRLLAAPEPLRIRPRKIMVVGDLAPPNWRRLIAERFGLDTADVLDVFGSIEIGAIAHWSERTGLYHFHDHILPEVVAPDVLATGGRWTPGGRGDGALLLTSLTRDYFPAVRYLTGDHITGLRAVAGPHGTTYAFERIDGRLAGDFKHGERLSAHDISQAMAVVFPNAAYAADDTDGLVISVAHPVHDHLVDALRRLLRRSAPSVDQMIASGLVREIRVVEADAAELRTRSAKRRFQSEVS